MFHRKSVNNLIIAIFKSDIILEHFVTGGGLPAPASPLFLLEGTLFFCGVYTASFFASPPLLPKAPHPFVEYTRHLLLPEGTSSFCGVYTASSFASPLLLPEGNSSFSGVYTTLIFSASPIRLLEGSSSCSGVFIYFSSLLSSATIVDLHIFEDELFRSPAKVIMKIILCIVFSIFTHNFLYFFKNLGPFENSASCVRDAKIHLTYQRKPSNPGKEK